MLRMTRASQGAGEGMPKNDAHQVSLVPPSPQGSTEPGIGDLRKIGAGEGIRTLDPDLGKVVLYP